jgi:hypothetical protein
MGRHGHTAASPASLRTFGLPNDSKDCTMPIRFSSLTKRIASNGAMLSQARRARTHALGADHEPSTAEQALAEQRRLLKEEQAKRQAQALQPGPTALDKLVRTHHAAAKDKPKPTKEGKEPKAAKADKAAKAGKATRAEKHVAKASALDAARRADKKSAKT